MGKRSTFERHERDFYPTPPEAVEPLIEHLPTQYRFRYWEPCAGDGALVEALSGLTLSAKCVFQSDIEPRHANVDPFNALTGNMSEVIDHDFIITNPPWDRKILHPMIKHFSAMRPTWLLFDADWVHTKQSVPFMSWLRKVVSVGRVKWIPDSKHTGKDNCCWHLFDQKSKGPTEFVGRTV